nr:dihydroorotate dehydrogenase [Paenibacillus sp. 481]
MSYGFGHGVGSIGFILVLFILLVIITRGVLY